MTRRLAFAGLVGAVVALAQTPAGKGTGKPGKGSVTPDITDEIVAPVEVRREMPLPPGTLAALALSDQMQQSGPQPVRGPNGRLIFTYGQGVPTVVCSILQVCEVDLEAGETLAKDALDWGDQPRFRVVARQAGTGAAEYTYLVMKPLDEGLDTTLVVGTNRRSYYMRLISSERGHMTQVAFRYPEEEAAKQEADEKARASAEAAEKSRRDAEAASAASAAALNVGRPLRNWHYYKVTLHGKDAAWLKPQSVADDGAHTYIVLGTEARRRGLPVAQVTDARGPVPVNVRWEGSSLIVDAIFERGCLLEGVGRKQQKACITNEGASHGR